MSKKKKWLLICLAILPFVLKIGLFLDDYISVFAGASIFSLITAVNMIFIGDKDTFVKHNIITAAAWIICELTSWYICLFVIESELQYRNNWLDLGMVFIACAVLFAVVVTVIMAVIKSVTSDKGKTRHND